jgi:hypothetical protein
MKLRLQTLNNSILIGKRPVHQTLKLLLGMKADMTTPEIELGNILTQVVSLIRKNLGMRCSCSLVCTMGEIKRLTIGMTCSVLGLNS